MGGHLPVRPPNQNVGGTCPPVPSIFAAPETLPIDDAKAGGVWSGKAYAKKDRFHDHFFVHGSVYYNRLNSHCHVQCVLSWVELF